VSSQSGVCEPPGVHGKISNGLSHVWIVWWWHTSLATCCTSIKRIEKYCICSIVSHGLYFFVLLYGLQARVAYNQGRLTFFSLAYYRKVCLDDFHFIVLDESGGCFVYPW